MRGTLDPQKSQVLTRIWSPLREFPDRISVKRICGSFYQVQF
jgi:hypothetical protein